MALRAGYKGFKKLLPGLKLFRPGTLGIDNDVLIPELNKTFFPRSEQAVLGAVNIAPYPYSGSAGSAGGTTYTLDGPVIDVNCSNSSGVSSFSISGINKTLLKSGITYYLSGAPAISASTENVRLYIILNDDNNNEQRVYCPQGGEIAFTVPDGYFLNAMGYYVAAGQTLDHVKVKPMIALSAGLSYVEPAMTNKELTDEVSAISNSALTNVTAEPDTVTSLGSFTLKKGKYIVTAIASMSKQTSDFDISISFSSSSTAFGTGRFDSFNGKAPLAAAGGIQATKMFDVSSDTTVYIVTNHNHSSAVALFPAVSIAKV